MQKCNHFWKGRFGFGRDGAPGRTRKRTLGPFPRDCVWGTDALQGPPFPISLGLQLYIKSSRWPLTATRRTTATYRRPRRREVTVVLRRDLVARLRIGARVRRVVGRRRTKDRELLRRAYIFNFWETFIRIQL